jgi:hypothetical protein
MVTAGCTTLSQGEPAPATTVETTSSGPQPSSTDGGQELPFAGAPKVDNPLDTTRFQQDPCQALTPEQAQGLTFPPTGEPREAPLGKACTWTNPETEGLVEIHFSDRDPRGLSAQYKVKDEYAYFVELSLIEGYPAIAADVVEDRDIGQCTVSVGVSDETTFSVAIRLSQVNVAEKDPCQTAAMVAGLALQTMKKD